MKSTRHPHPHIDPRQPLDNSSPGTNPPVFAWKPVQGQTHFSLTVYSDPGLEHTVIDVSGLTEPVFLPEKGLSPGRYYWVWAGDSGEFGSDVFSFDITKESVLLEVPCVEEWLKRFPDSHPCIYTRPEHVEPIRTSRTRERADMWKILQENAEKLLAEDHELEEPPFLPDRSVDYEKYFSVWHRVLRESRQFMRGAERLGLAYLASGEEKFARAACKRLASVSEWNPEGSSYLPHNDEAHMSIIWHGPQACDWVWDQFTDRERERVIEQFKKRGEITFEFMHDKGSYGVTRFDSHAGREIVFLAQIALVFREHIPQAATWLEWLRPVLCGIWPIWAQEDGAWAEGPSYGLAYVRIMTMFATTLKQGAGIDLYKRPFWKGHARWREYCFPPYAEWVGFGDSTERSSGKWNRNADLVDIIARHTGTGEFTTYIKQFRQEARNDTDEPAQDRPVSDQLYLADPPLTENSDADNKNIFHEFPGAGWCAVRTDLDHKQKDVALIFRSSPLGAVSHSHANNNDFIMHVGGRVLAMPSGYYNGYGSDHHTHWVWHTKSHNCITLSDSGQLMRSHDSLGSIDNSFQDDNIVYFRGTADASYQDRAHKCRRHLLFLREHQCFVMVDEFKAKEDICSGVQWNIHSWEEFNVDEDNNSFRLERGSSRLTGYFMYNLNSFFIRSTGWDPEPAELKSKDQYLPQFNLRFCPTNLVFDLNLGVILCPGHDTLTPPDITRERTDSCETARIGSDLVMINHDTNNTMSHDNITSPAIAALQTHNTLYEVTDQGISTSRG